MSITTATQTPPSQVSGNEPGKTTSVTDSLQDDQVKKSSPHYIVIALSVIIIVAGLFAFLAVPLLGAARVLPLDPFHLAAATIGGFFLTVIGFVILGRTSPKKSIPASPITS